MAGEKEAMKSVSLIMVNFNTETHVLSTLMELRSRPEELPDQLIVIDNSPAYGLSQELAGLDLDVDYLATNDNLGFAGGVNLGLELCKGRFIILLNPDACPDRGCLAGLIDTLGYHEDIAVAGPALLSLAETPQPMVSATKSDPTLLTTLVEYTALHRLVSKDWLLKNYFVAPGGERTMVDCAMVQGACFAFKRNWLRRVGIFDAETFFLYWEETDFCRRIRNHGGRVIYCPKLTCRHQGGASVSGNQDIHLFWRSLYGYHHKHHGPFAGLVLRLLLIPGMATELVILQLLLYLRHGDDRQLERHIERMRLLLIEQFRPGDKKRVQ